MLRADREREIPLDAARTRRKISQKVRGTGEIFQGWRRDPRRKVHAKTHGSRKRLRKMKLLPYEQRVMQRIETGVYIRLHEFSKQRKSHDPRLSRALVASPQTPG